MVFFFVLICCFWVSFIGLLGRTLSQVCSTLSFLIPLHSLVLGSSLACALLVVPLSWTSVGHPGSVR